MQQLQVAAQHPGRGGVSTVLPLPKAALSFKLNLGFRSRTFSQSVGRLKTGVPSYRYPKLPASSDPCSSSTRLNEANWFAKVW